MYEIRCANCHCTILSEEKSGVCKKCGSKFELEWPARLEEKLPKIPAYLDEHGGMHPIPRKC